MTSRAWIVCGAVLGSLAVALGAFGAHLLPEWLAETNFSETEIARRLEIFDTAAQYQILHALALLAVGIIAKIQNPSRWLTASGMALLLGTLVFSGLLYVLVFAGENWSFLGAIVPLGGLSLIAGWLLLAIAAWKSS